MPVEDHKVHPSTKIGDDFRWGCWNLPRERKPLMVKDGHNIVGFTYGEQTTQHWTEIEDFGSIGCRNDFSLIDWHCRGCEHIGSGEEYARTVQMRAEMQDAVRAGKLSGV